MSLKLNAKWTDDCSGKKDYDSNVLTISSRYWPAGGSALVFDPASPELGLQENSDGTPCSASSYLLLWYMKENGSEEYLELSSATPSGAYLTGPDHESVAAQVEEWAQKTLNRVVKAVKAEFDPENKPLEITKHTGYLIHGSTGCSCCKNENFVVGLFDTLESATETAKGHKLARTVRSQYSDTGIYTVYQVEYELLPDGRIILERKHLQESKDIFVEDYTAWEIKNAAGKVLFSTEDK